MVNLATPAIQLKVDSAVFLINLQIQALVSRWVLVNISILGHLGLGCSVFSDDPVGQSKQGWSWGWTVIAFQKQQFCSKQCCLCTFRER